MSHYVLIATLLFATILCHLGGVMTNTSPDCSSPSDCSPGECCVIGMMRYSIPRCVKLGDVGDHCINNGEPRNFTVSFPNGAILKLTNVHTLFCPCSTDRKLQCHRGSCSLPNHQSEAEVDYNYVF